MVRSRSLGVGALPYLVVERIFFDAVSVANRDSGVVRVLVRFFHSPRFE